MELYLDSANLSEIEEAFKLGYLAGLTTTPTFMHREGVTDLDATIQKLAKMVPVLQLEALGDSAEEIEAEAHRLLGLGLEKEKTVFKIPMSLEGTRACKMLVNQGLMVNLHLIYTVQQAYMAMSAGATYVCPLVGRLQDQGHDALGVIEQCVSAVEYYGYDSKVMFSSVRHPEHVRNALNLGVHTCTIPWKVMQQLTTNHFTEIGTQQFVEHTRLITLTVKDVIRKTPTTIGHDKSILDALVTMTVSKYGAVSIVDDNGNLSGIFTDGDLRRNLEQKGESFMHSKLADLELSQPISIDVNAQLINASEIIKSQKVDTIVVTDNGKPVGMLDIQDLIAN